MKNKLGNFYLFAMMSGNYEPNIWLFISGIVFIAISILIKRVFAEKWWKLKWKMNKKQPNFVFRICSQGRKMGFFCFDKNLIRADCFGRSIACKRYKRYFNCYDIYCNNIIWHNRIDKRDAYIYNIDKARMTWMEDRVMEKYVTLEEALKRIEELEKRMQPFGRNWNITEIVN